MQYEEMDGAFAAYFPKDDKIIDLFKSAATVIVDDPTGLYQVQAFPLDRLVRRDRYAAQAVRLASRK